MFDKQIRTRAEAELRTALMRDPQMAAAHYEFGRLRYYRGDPYRAIDGCLLAERVSPNYAESKSYPKIDLMKGVTELMAKGYEYSEDYDRADAAWRKLASLQRGQRRNCQTYSATRKNYEICFQEERNHAAVNPA